MPFIIVFILVSILEITLLIEIGQYLGGVATFLLMVLTTFAGIALVRHQGLRILQKAQMQMLQGQTPNKVVLSGMMLFIAGVLFLLPGFFTDGIGLLLLLPPVRQWVALGVLKHLGTLQGRGFYFQSGNGRSFHAKPSEHRTYEGEFEVKEESADSLENKKK